MITGVLNWTFDPFNILFLYKKNSPKIKDYSMITPGPDGLFHPKSEAEIIELIQHARTNQLQVRVRGAAQSADGAVFTDGFTDAASVGKNINIELDKIRDISIDKDNMRVTVGGGLNLGFDPFDPSHESAPDKPGISNNLYFQLNQNGLAIPNVSNAIHQSVAGYISTGSSGGTLKHSFHEFILSIRIIDGTGQVQVFEKSENPDDAFFGVGVSLGLMGIITQLVLQCVPAFNIIGIESTTRDNACVNFDFLGAGTAGRPSLQAHITDTEFLRILWWPFSTLKRTISWQAKTMQPGDYNSNGNDTGTPTDFKPNPYTPIFPPIKLGSTESRLPSEGVAATGFQLIATWPRWFNDVLGHDPSQNTAEERILIKTLQMLFPFAYPLLTDLFFPINTHLKPAKKFWDNWLGSLPMDQFEYSNDLFDLVYCEFWISIDKTAEVINLLNDHYQQNGYSATSFYTLEILAAKQTDFWISPSYGSNMLRLNILYFRKTTVTPHDYFQQFWDLFHDNQINFRLHWGKTLPSPGDDLKPSFLTSQYPKWNNWKELRTKMDPDNIFLTTYWNTRLGISE